MKKLPICRNCLAYNWDRKECGVSILYEGNKINLPTSPADECFFVKEGIDVQEVKIWCENELGEKTNKGIVKIEYPKDFFGKTDDFGSNDE